MATIPDNSSVPGTGLRKVTSTKLEGYERDLIVYGVVFRKLQLRENAYQNFFTEVIRTTRQKHLDLLQRGTEASFHQITQIVLRGFGYLIWPEDSHWLIPDSDLNEGEQRLTYDRKNQKLGNQEFYPIFHELWACMRNLVFEPKKARSSTDSVLGNTGTDRSPSTESTSASLNTSSVSINTYDNPVTSLNLIPSIAQSSSTMATSRRMTIGGEPTYLSVAETESGIRSAVQKLTDTRTAAHPIIFKRIWEQHIVQAEKFDTIQHDTNNSSGRSTVDVTGFLYNKIPNTSQSHSASRIKKVVVTNQNAAEIADTLPKDIFGSDEIDNQTLNASLSTSTGQLKEKDFSVSSMPEYMSVHINSSRVTHYNDVYLNRVTPAAWLQPGARVRLEDMQHFLWSLEMRAGIPQNCKVFYYVLSYNWSDGMLVIQNDRPGYMLNEGETQCQEKRKHGWHNFMLDIEAAALKGNKEWSMKCMVLFGETVDEETDSTRIEARVANGTN